MGIEILAAALTGAGVSGGIGVFGTEIAFSTIGAYALVGGALVGGTLLSESLTKKHESEQQTLKQSLPPRQRGYGQALVAGSYYFYANFYGSLYSGFILCEGPIAGVIQHWFNDQNCPDGGAIGKLSQYGKADMWPWNDHVEFFYQNGSPDQFPNYLLQQCGITSLNKGLVNTVMKCSLPSDPSKNFSKSFPSGVPQYRAELQLALVYDPRVAAQKWTDNTTWAWSDNSALCVLDYLTNPRAMAIPTAQIDVASFIAAANAADEAVPLAAGGIEKRYRVWTMYTFDEEPKNVLARLLKTCDGELYMTPAGTIALRGGAWTTPTVTITADMVQGVEAHRGRDKLAKYNELKIRYLYAFYAVVEGDPWDDVAGQAAAGQVLPEDFDGSSIPSYAQCLRLAKIQMAKDNPDWLFTVTTSIAGLNALGERIVTFDFPDLGVHRTCFVNSFEIAEDGATCKIGLGTLDASAYTWSTTEERTGATPIPHTNATQYIPPAPTGLALSLNRVSTGDGGYVSTLQAQIDVPADTSLLMAAQYRLDGAATWSDMSVDNATYTATSPPVSDQQTYDVQVALQSYGGADGPFVASTIQVVADSTSPGPPTSFSVVSPGDGSATLSWTNPNASNYFATKIYRGPTADMSQAVVIATAYGSAGSQRSLSVQPQSGQNFYWAKAVNRSNLGDSAGPLEVDA